MKKLKEFNPDGYEVVYISDYFFDVLEKELNKITRFQGSPSHYPPVMALRDESTRIEFRRKSLVPSEEKI